MAGRPLALNPGANQYTGPTCGTKKCFILAAKAGDITNTVNKGRKAGTMSSLLLLDVYGVSPLLACVLFALLFNFYTSSSVQDT